MIFGVWRVCWPVLAFRVRPSPFRSPPSAWLWGLLLVGCLMAGHVVYWTDMRMRAPLMPVVAIIAASGLFRLVRDEG